MSVGETKTTPLRVYCVYVTVAVPVAAQNDVEAEAVGQAFAKDEMANLVSPLRVQAVRCRKPSDMPGGNSDTIPWQPDGNLLTPDQTLGELLP